jgi:predicted esterase
MALVPEASSTLGPGYTWDTTDTALIDGAIDDIQRCYNTDLHHQILHGFSAGGLIAYIMGLGPDDSRFSGLAIASSDLGTAEYYAAQSKLPALLPSAWEIPASLFHGEQDPNFPFAQCGEGSRDALLDAGHTVYFHPFTGGHTTNAADALQQYEDLESSISPSP